MITALNQGYKFGFTFSVPGTETINGYTNCQGGPAGQYNGINGAYNVTNAEGPQSASTQSLYTGTTQSVNVFYAQLEKQVGLVQRREDGRIPGHDQGGRHVDC